MEQFTSKYQPLGRVPTGRLILDRFQTIKPNNKEGSAVPDVDINRAIERQQLFVADPAIHTYEEEQLDG